MQSGRIHPVKDFLVVDARALIAARFAIRPQNTLVKTIYTDRPERVFPEINPATIHGQHTLRRQELIQFVLRFRGSSGGNLKKTKGHLIVCSLSWCTCTPPLRKSLQHLGRGSADAPSGLRD